MIVPGSVPEIMRLNDLCENKEPYTTAISRLEEIFLEAQSADKGRSAIAIMFIWPAHVHADFMDLLDMREPKALVILAYYAAMLRVRGDTWWVKGWGRLILDYVRQAQHDYDEWLEWPQNFGVEERLS